MQLDKNDYEEPRCVLCGTPGKDNDAKPVPQDRIQEKLHEYEDRNDWPAVERHLKYWLEEAETNRDERGQLMLHNELMGYYRKQEQQEQAFFHAIRASELVEKLRMEDTITAGTTWVNVGTVREAFSDPQGGMEYFQKARANYEKNLPSGDGRLGGLYNNMALCLTACERYDEAESMFLRALEVMKNQKHGELEQAITWMNLADNAEAALGAEAAEEKVEQYLERAEALLNTDSLPRNGYYAFVCEKCAPAFGHYGWFLTEAELNRRAKEICGES